ncbi:RWD domain-containing protein, partial [Delphinella strobiligena]
MADYDEREEELSSIAAIFPELVIDSNDTFAASIDLPVAPSAPLTVRFPAASLPSPPNSDDGNQKQTYAAAVQALKDEHKLHHLPPLHLDVVLPEGYPASAAPKVTLSTQPEWLPADRLRQLTQDAESLWEEFGKCQILFSYIDHLQQSADRAFQCEDGLDLPPALKPELLDYDAKTKIEVFDAQTFDCGVCLEPKKGSECYRLQRCRHVFCRDCLQETCNTYIKEGDVVHVRCLDPTCGKEDTTPQALLQRKGKADRTLHPRELLDIGIEEPIVRRYVEMKRKKKLEADKSTVYCPRSWCQAPARSAKYPPLPADLRDYPDSDSDDDTEDGKAEQQPNAPEKTLSTAADRLCICSNSNCTLAFCRICYSGWHGEFARCWPRNPLELSDEDKASYDYIRMHTSPCPTCSSPVQKTMGCNHMTCFQCQTHFCYLCGAWLDGSNPYMHFNRGGSDCYQRLWELEEGDEDQGNGFGGARMWEQEARRVAEEADRQEAERLQDQENERAVLMDAEGEEAADDFPLRLNGGQMMPEAPAPPAAGHIDPALAAQFARLQQPQALDEDVAAAAFRRFVELAARDQEEEWDSDELDD